MTLNPAQLGALRGLLAVIIAAGVHWFTIQSNLTGIFPAMLSAVVAALATSYEAHLSEGAPTALFGAIRKR